MGTVRNNSSTSGTKRLIGLLKEPWPNKKAAQDRILSDILSAKKASAKIDERILAEIMQTFREKDILLIVSAFKANWQSAYLLNINLINAIVSTDSNF